MGIAYIKWGPCPPILYWCFMKLNEEDLLKVSLKNLHPNKSSKSVLFQKWPKNPIHFEHHCSRDLFPIKSLAFCVPTFLGCTSCYKDTFAQLHRKKGREFMFICRHIVETIPRLRVAIFTELEF